MHCHSYEVESPPCRMLTLILNMYKECTLACKLSKDSMIYLVYVLGLFPASGVAKLGHTGACALATRGCAPPVQALSMSIANWALKPHKGVEIELAPQCCYLE